MFQHLMIAVDGSELSEKAVRHGCLLAKALNARVTLVTVRVALLNVSTSFGPPMFNLYTSQIGLFADQGEFEAQSKTHAQNLLKHAAELATELGITAEITLREHELPWRGILDAAQACSADLLVMASHGRGGVGALILGSETQKVLTHSTLPVLVVR